MEMLEEFSEFVWVVPHCDAGPNATLSQLVLAEATELSLYRHIKDEGIGLEQLAKNKGKSVCERLYLLSTECV